MKVVRAVTFLLGSLVLAIVSWGFMGGSTWQLPLSFLGGCLFGLAVLSIEDKVEEWLESLAKTVIRIFNREVGLSLVAGISAFSSGAYLVTTDVPGLDKGAVFISPTPIGVIFAMFMGVVVSLSLCALVLRLCPDEYLKRRHISASGMSTGVLVIVCGLIFFVSVWSWEGSLVAAWELALGFRLLTGNPYDALYSRKWEVV